MNGFLKLIPGAVANPYAYGAYAIAAALFVLVGARLRSVRVVLREIRHVPEEDRRHVIESVTNSIIPETITAAEWVRSNRNRSIFQLLAVVVLLGAAIITIAILSPNTIKPAPPEKEAAAEAEAFLAKLDAGDYSGAYSRMAGDFRQTFPLDKWLTASATYRTPLGAATARKNAEASASEQSFGGRPFNVLTYTYYTQFPNQDRVIAEYVTLASAGTAEPWRVIAYHIGIDPNTIHPNR